jgi:hypothetical protein
MEAIGIRQVFQVQPKALNWIEKWAVFGQPEDQDAVFKSGQRR